MPFYLPPSRRNLFQMTRQRYDPPAPPFRRINYLPPVQNPYESRPYFNPYEQPPYGRAPADLNTMMGHVGTITNGINMMRQIGGVLGLFR